MLRKQILLLWNKKLPRGKIFCRHIMFPSSKDKTTRRNNVFSAMFPSLSRPLDDATFFAARATKFQATWTKHGDLNYKTPHSKNFTLQCVCSRSLTIKPKIWSFHVVKVLTQTRPHRQEKRLQIKRKGHDILFYYVIMPTTAFWSNCPHYQEFNS